MKSGIPHSPLIDPPAVVACVVLAKSPREVAEICGGYYVETEEKEWLRKPLHRGTVHFPEKLFTPIPPDDEKYYPILYLFIPKGGEIMEYRKDQIRFLMERGAGKLVLHICEVPLLQVISESV